MVVVQFAISPILFVILLCPLLLAYSSDPMIAQPGCTSTCGNVTISYPFGMGNPNCYVDEWFQIECKKHKSILKKLQVEVIKIDVTSSKVVIMNPIYRQNCNSKVDDDDNDNDRGRGIINMRGSPFVYCEEDNRFVSVGCNTLSLFHSNGTILVGGCFSICDKHDDSTLKTLEKQFCHGRYCCESSLPKDLLEYNITIEHINDTNLSITSDCNYAFIASEGWIYSAPDYVDAVFENLGNLSQSMNLGYVPAVLDWQILKNKNNNNIIIPHFQNTSNHYCNDSDILSPPNNDLGFQCHCNSGYYGNPYLSQGCTEILKNQSKMKPTGEGVLSAIGSSVFLIGLWWLYKTLRRRRKQKLKQKYFKQNGGLLLNQKLLSSDKNNFDKTKLFNSKDLEKATDHFNMNRVIGKGGQGTVYKGMLADGQIVAVKKLKVKENIEEIINEVVILSQINHRNVVNLLGFCLETEDPLLVYEFIPNGNLSEYLINLDDDHVFLMSWEKRLRIANEIAGALFYLHSYASQPIYHRDIKSTNILLDEKYRAKIADFGTCRMASIEDTHLTTQVKGTFGYLDPEYFRTGQLSEKSDVYSFGVVLVELLTSEKPISSERQGEDKSLASYFIRCMEEDCVSDILDKRLVMEGVEEDMLAIANLAKRCLELNGRERPTMREVTMELEGIQKMGKTFN